MTYFPFFAIGVLLKGHYNSIRVFVEHKLILFTCISTLILIMTILTVKVGQFEGIPFIAPLLVCCCLWVYSVAFATLFKNERVFSYFGVYSLQYYLNHLLIMLLCFYAGALVFNVSPLLSLFLIYVLAVIISTIMLYIEKRFSWSRFLCGFN